MLRFSRSGESAADQARRPGTRIVDGAAAKAWLAAMAQPGSPESLADITQVLQALGPSGVDDGGGALQPQRRFAIAERIRAVLLPILQERSADERLSLSPVDDELVRHCWAAIDAAAALRDAYAWLVSQLASQLASQLPSQLGDAPAAVDAATAGPTVASATPAPTAVSGIGALHRALDVNAQLMLCIQRAHWAVPNALWERHCVLAQLVRDLDCQDAEVVDAQRVSITRTCRAAVVTPVLVALADPAARTATEFHVVRLAAQRWAAKVGFRLERRVDGGVAPARPVANPGPTVHLAQSVLRLDTQSTMQSIDRRLEALADGKTPREAGIGDSLRPQAARDLLLQLRQRWGAVSPADIDSPDRAWRAHGGALTVMAVVGMPHADGRRRDTDAGRVGANPYAYQRARHGAVTQPREAIALERVTRLLANAESWTLAAEAADAVRCVRRYPRPQIGLQRLIGLKLGTAGGDAPFLAGWIEALQGTVGRDADGRTVQTGAQSVRVRLAPGIPQIVQAAVDDVALDWAFLLVPGVAATLAGRPTRPTAFVPMLSDPGTNAGVPLVSDGEGWDAVRRSPRDHGLILPLATFRPDRIVKAGRAGLPATLRLEELMMRGADFDLVRFTVM